MISIIICSTKENISDTFLENINQTIGIDYEIIIIDNSKNEYSIFSAYNKGVSLSKFPCLCFIHQDVLFKTQDWGINVIEHLKDKQTGLIGVAGGKIMTRIPAHWWALGHGCKHLIQQYNNKKKSGLERTHPFDSNRQAVILLDGVFLGVRKELFSEIKFDEHLSGFHGYDQDISVQSVMAGYTNYFITDILLEHLSEGNVNANYYKNLLSIYRKWNQSLPLFSSEIPDNVKDNIEKTEIKLLSQLVRRLAQHGFATSEIIKERNFYLSIINSNAAKRKLNWIRLRIGFEKLFHSK